MKNRILTFVSVCLLALCSAACDDEKVITFDNLPAEAQTTINTYFADKTVSSVMKEGANYDVYFTDGDNIEFNRKGEWEEINCKNPAVPAGLVPAPITDYIAANYPNALIWTIEKDGTRTDIKLNTGLELTFDKNYNLVEVDR